MKISDYIATVIGGYCPFTVQGGAAVHLIDSLARGGAVGVPYRYVCVAHEQAAGFAADGYAKARGLGVAVTTCGPGATNLLTAAASAYFERVPVLYLVGQQPGFQELDVVGMFKTVTRFARVVSNPFTLADDLEQALCVAHAERGPVLLNVFDAVYHGQTDASPTPWGVVSPYREPEPPVWAKGEQLIFAGRRQTLKPEAYDAPSRSVNPYHFMRELHRHPGALVTDIGNHGVWAKQSALAAARRVISDNNFGAMGYGIAASMGVACAGQTAVCVTGDGSIQMNIQELATIAKHDMDVKIFILNDAGYGMIRATQGRWLEGRNFGCDLTDLPLVDFERVATAYGIPNRRWQAHDDLDFEEVFAMKGPVLVNVTVDPKQGVY